MMAGYDIIDEPKAKPYESFILNPIIILLAAIFVPLFLSIPPYLKILIPLVWLCVNGYLLGSSTLKKEIIIAVFGAIAWLLCFFVIAFIVSLLSTTTSLNWTLDSSRPYVYIISQGVFFFTLYMIVMKQSISYDLYAYLKERGQS